MNDFPPLSTWFSINVNVTNIHRYTRYDLGLLPGADLNSFAQHLACLIARLRLNSNELVEWNKYWNTDLPIPNDWKARFKAKFWRGFVSSTATEEAGGKIQPDDTALQGHIGELLLYIIAHQLHKNQIDVVPRKPKNYSKDSGIDCLEITGEGNLPESMHYVVWESKGLTSDSIGDYPRKIYNQLLYETPKTFSEAVDQLADLHQGEQVLAEFIDQMIDDFFHKPPTSRKCFGCSVSFSASNLPGPHVFNKFTREFRNELFDDPQCRQIRFCALGDLKKICDEVWRSIWNKLLP
jgi:hypothetical protein